MSTDIWLEFTALDGTKAAVGSSSDKPEEITFLDEKQLAQIETESESSNQQETVH